MFEALRAGESNGGLGAQAFLARRSSFGPGVVVFFCALAVGGWCFRSVLFRGELFAFRDAGHYYAPLYRYVHEQWAAGRVPLWNPYENFGQPLAADPTAAVFYPGKLVFAVVPRWEWAWRAYVLGHLALALWTAYLLARRLGAGIIAAGAGALSYAFSGTVLFQHCNVPYLVGAAWLPLALWAVDRMCWCKATREAPSSEPRQQSDRPADDGQTGRPAGPGPSMFAPVFFLALTLSMMTLGGDPQTAYHTVLLAGLYLLLMPRAGADGAADGAKGLARAAGRGPALAGLLCAGLLAGLLSAVQVLPAWELAAQSSRTPEPWRQRLLGHWQPGSHAEQAYHFSVGPWRFAEFVWPNVGGRQLPVHRRWFEAIPAEGRVWTPSLYFGAVPLVLALGAMQLRRSKCAEGRPAYGPATARRRWLSWMALLGLLAALGWYGAGWILHEMRTACGGDPDHWLLGAPAGGLYWLMRLVLPGYARFRYPAKWLVAATLGFSMLSALGWQQMVDRAGDAMLKRFKGLAILSLVLAAVAVVLRPWWPKLVGQTPPDPLFGPLDVEGAWQDLMGALVQTALVCAVFWRWTSRLASPTAGKRSAAGDAQASSRPPQSGDWGWWAALVVVAADLAAANGWLVPGAPARLWQERPALGRLIAQHEIARPAAHDRMACVWREPIFLPQRWRESGSAKRLCEEVAWDRDTLFPKYNLQCRIRVLGVYGAFVTQSAERLLACRPLARGLASWAILPAGERLDHAEEVATGVSDVSLWRRRDVLPRAWIEHPKAAAMAHGRRADLDDYMPKFHTQTQEGEWCRLVEEEPDRVVLEANLVRPGLLVLADQYYPGWQLRAERAGRQVENVEVVAVAGALRGVWLQAGRYRLVFCYRPMSLMVGGVLSGLGWVAVAVLLVGWWRRQGRALRKPGKTVSWPPGSRPPG